MKKAAKSKIEKPIKIGIVAPSSIIPKVEFELGNEHLQLRGYQTEVHLSVFGEYYFYPGTDQDRANAFLEYAFRDDLDALWCARGGYGASHLLPFLEKATLRKKPKKKTLLGYSDATALLEFARVRWGWNTIHAPMPSLRTFSLLKPEEWDSATALIGRACRNEKYKPSTYELDPIYVPKNFKGVQAPVVGGNLSVWNAMIGTKYAGNARGKILFFEEIQENVARINRMLHHLEQSGGLKGVKAIVLGDFLDCNDTVPQCLQKLPEANVNFEEYLRHPPKEAMGLMRTPLSSAEALDFVFSSLGERNQIPVYRGLPIGHGPNFHSIQLGQKASLKKNGQFSA
jgi:muramoyltetrapeptide carboxypeptidase